MSADYSFWRERRAEAESNQNPSAYQPNALLLSQTGFPYPHPHASVLFSLMVFLRGIPLHDMHHFVKTSMIVSFNAKLITERSMRLDESWNNNHVHLSHAHQCPERSHNTYEPKYDILYTCRALSYQKQFTSSIIRKHTHTHTHTHIHNPWLIA